MIKNILLVALGGSAGSVLRYLSQKFIGNLYIHPFPWGTLIVNITGCFLIGILWAVISRSISMSDEFRLLLMTGFCGGFTTFSAFTLESITLIKEQRLFLFSLYIITSVIVGLLATFAGMKLIK
ncbi:MAG: fluoride efflux transporter CrcB [Bacteroidetes bacterium]|nr:fluoride efflux transporter CrcB [Bacteroidota bacterium]MBS1610450.1 fluoride efflux transporter CrcB [Bacteroidota bacterium]